MRVLLFRGRGIISCLIRWFTRSQYSHAAITFSAPGEPLIIIEAWQGEGVREHHLESTKDVDFFEVESLTPEQIAGIKAFMLAEIGSPYDYWNIIGFITRRPRRSNDAWQCAEIIYAAIESVGVALLSGVKAFQVYPGMLPMSPRMKKLKKLFP